MPFKINISEKSGKTYKLETESQALIGKSLHDKIKGKDVSPELEGYEFEIAGASDKSGFTAMKEVEGIGLKKVLLGYGKSMKKRPKHEGKKPQSNKTPGGLRLRKTVRGKVISEAISQINLKILKNGSKKLAEIFPDQNKSREPETPAEQSKEETKPDDAENKEQLAEQKSEEATQPDKEPKGEAPKEGIEEAKE